MSGILSSVMSSLKQPSNPDNPIVFFDIAIGAENGRKINILSVSLFLC